MPRFLMVLNDGETFTDVDGCHIAVVPDEIDIDEIEEILDAAKAYDAAAVFSVVDGQVVANSQESADEAVVELMRFTPQAG